MKTFSVIIPAYNASQTIELAIQSCLNQQQIPIEIIVVDDGSYDDTIQKVQQFNNDTIKLISLKENSGVSVARNTAWDIARGDFIAFLDSDDQWHPQKLQLISEHLQKNEIIDLIFNKYSIEDFDAKMLENTSIISRSFSDFLWSNPAQTSCICLRRALDFRFNTKMSYCEDHDLLLRIAYHQSCFELPMILTKLGRPQLAKGGLSAQHWKMRKGEIKAYTHLAKLHIGFILLIPFLYLFSLLKHFRKMIQLNFSN